VAIAPIRKPPPARQHAEEHGHPANWYAICSKFRSFDPKTGTYRAYSGKTEPCRPAAAAQHHVNRTAAAAPASEDRRSPGQALLDFLSSHAPPTKGGTASR
jgi:hypothetical protein